MFLCLEDSLSCEYRAELVSVEVESVDLWVAEVLSSKWCPPVGVVSGVVAVAVVDDCLMC